MRYSKNGRGWHRESRRHSLASRGIKTAKSKTTAMNKVSQTFKVIPEDEFNKEKYTEKEVKLLMRRINDKKINVSKLFERNKLLYDGEGVALTDEQNKKGYDFLMSRWKTPTGKVKESSPYGSRETDILENFDEIRFKDVYSERGNYYVPLYLVCSKDGDCFEYYYVGGEISIVG